MDGDRLCWLCQDGICVRLVGRDDENLVSRSKAMDTVRRYMRNS